MTTRHLRVIPTTGARELALTVEQPGELILSVQWPTAVHPEARVMLDASAAAELLGTLAGWLGLQEDARRAAGVHVPGQLPLPEHDDEPGAWGPTAAQEAGWDAREDEARGGHA